MEKTSLRLVSVLCVLFVSGVPLGTAKTTWRQHSNHHARRTSDPVVVPLSICEAAGSDLDSLLIGWTEASDTFEPLFEMMMSRPIEEFRGSDLFCALQGVDSIDELYHRLKTGNGEYYMYRAFRLGYHSVVLFGISQMRYYYVTELETSHVTDEHREYLEELLSLMNHLQASGITGLDPEGYQQILDLSGVMEEDWPEPEPLSDLPLEAQCAMITNDLRKVWNRVIKFASEWMPEASTYYRELLRNVTGIDIPTGAQTHHVMNDAVCRLIEPSQLGDLYERMNDMEILPSIFRYEYHEMVHAVEMFESEPPHHYYYPDESPDDEPGGGFDLFQSFLNNLHAMGLLELQ